MNALKRWWNDMGHAWAVFDRAQRPWEQEGPLRWHKAIGGEWELHGATMPLETGLERDLRR